MAGSGSYPLGHASLSSKPSRSAALSHELAMLFPSPIQATTRLVGRAELLGDRLEVGQDLTRVEQVRQRVDHRHGRRTPPAPTSACAKVRMTIPSTMRAKHAGRVPDLLAPTDLAVPLGQEERVAPELGHADLERHPRACRALPEDHREALPGELRSVLARFRRRARSSTATSSSG
jgi:hypothetical protein